MGHRTGYVNGEGDGAGVQTDIPRQLWAKKLSKAGLPASLATQPGFWVGHFFIPHGVEYASITQQVNQHFLDADLNILFRQAGPVRIEALGINAQMKPASFWQIAGKSDHTDLETRLFEIQLKLEKSFSIHFASLSSHTVIYKVHGSVETLARYYPELQDRNYDTLMALCHARYSTNTVSTIERTQPFSLLGHNGEINTIHQFRQEAVQIGVQLPENGSDSQDVDRTIENLCIQGGLSLMEAMEIIFPPSPDTMDHYPSPMKEIYTHNTLCFGSLAQGPAAIAARYGDTAICSLDTLGLRPLWFTETEKEYIFSSERGTIQLEDMVTDSIPLAPGEKMGMVIQRGQKTKVITHSDIRQEVMKAALQRNSKKPDFNLWQSQQFEPNIGVQYLQQFNQSQVQQQVDQIIPNQNTSESRVLFSPDNEIRKLPWRQPVNHYTITQAILAAAGWNREQIQEVEEMASTGKEPVSSMGFDGPLAVLNQNRVNLADFFKESVAVVTNPAVDRGREIEAFSTRTIIGTRPEIGAPLENQGKYTILEAPFLTGGHEETGKYTNTKKAAHQLGILSIEELSSIFRDKITCLSLEIKKDQTVQIALNSLSQAAVEAVKSGIQCLILDDTEAITNKRSWLDPLLATASVDNALRGGHQNKNFRRMAGIVVRSASIRNLHDIILLYSFGADAINPYVMLSLAMQKFTAAAEAIKLNEIDFQVRFFQTLQAGLEKVISTIGCHDLRGYGRICSSIGLKPDIASIFQAPNFLGSMQAGINWLTLEKEARERTEYLQNPDSAKPASVDHLFPKFRKSVEQFISNQDSYDQVQQKYHQLTVENPIALRHILKIKTTPSFAYRQKVEIGIDGFDLPLVISAMSFGSQGELSYKAYAQAAKELNILCINGEGGELPEILGIYKKNRGQQVASGRFGVNAALLNSSRLIEIKIGQGAKPGEGGMLPAEKTTFRVAKARHTPEHIPLLSPSNNHDLYSIEDLAQLIEELKTVNPEARISVKCPCVPGIGVIAVGIVKAGADIINLSGYDGATGAARKHAIQNVGLPAEIGVAQAHRALLDAGMREKVEIWCDGGMKTGQDVVKMVLLGANRVGFASMAMVALGCTICRQCNEGNCHKGITTHIQTLEEAKKLGLKKFTPQDFDTGVKNLVRLFSAVGEEIRELTRQSGAKKLQDLVGRAHLLEQTAFKDRIDLSAMLTAVPVISQNKRVPGVGRLLTRPRNQLTRLISEMVLEAVQDGEKEVTYQDEVMAYDRALGSHLFGAMMRHPEINQSINQSTALTFQPIFNRG